MDQVTENQVLMQTLICLKCKEEKPVTEFSKWKNGATGYQTWCKDCMKKHSKQAYIMERKRENVRRKREDPVYRNREREINKETRLKNRVVFLLRSARDRAKQEGLPFSITKEDVPIPTHCPVLGVKLEVHTRYAPSIDKIEPSKGYIPGNVWVISWKANSMKLDASPDELKRFCEYWINNPVWAK